MTLQGWSIGGENHRVTATRALPHHPELLELLHQREAFEPTPVAVPRSVHAPRVGRSAGAFRGVALLAGLALMVAAVAVLGQQVAGSVDPRAWARYGNTAEMRSDAELAEAMVAAPDGYTAAPNSLELDPGPIDKAEAIAEETTPDAVAHLE